MKETDSIPFGEEANIDSFKRPSLATFGGLSPYLKGRISETLIDPNPQTEMARLWVEANKIDGTMKKTPIERVLHGTLSLRGIPSVVQNDFSFSGNTYDVRDIYVLNCAMVWLGCNGGGAFMSGSAFEKKPFYVHEYVQRYRNGRFNPYDPKTDYARRFLRYCKNCSERLRKCNHKPFTVSKRDRSLVDALMCWLGTLQGREFYDSYIKHMDALWETHSRQPIAV